MKKLLLITAALLFGFVCQAFAEKTAPLGNSNYKISVRSVNVIGIEDGSKVSKEYCIYIGNEETEEYDNMTADEDIFVCFQLLHPVEFLKEYNFQPWKRWYALYIDATKNTKMIGEMLTKQVWSDLPIILKHVVVALGINDNDLTLINFNAITGSVTILYNPKYDKDENFYIRKLEKLKKYFNTHDMNRDIPLSSVMTYSA
jgi:uncharacterized protein YxeA